MEIVYRCAVCRHERRMDAASCYECGARGSLERLERPAMRGDAPRRGLDVRRLDDEPAAEAQVHDDEEQVDPGLISLADVEPEEHERIVTGIEGVDRVFGDEDEAGIARGFAYMLAGARGCGKSTLLLTVSAAVGQQGLVAAYGQGENERIERFSSTAARIGLKGRALRNVRFWDASVVPERHERLERFLDLCDEADATLLVVDSIQGFADNPNDYRSCADVAEAIMKFASETNRIALMIGHLNVDGKAAGGAATQHLGDGVFLLERIGPKGKGFVHLYCDNKNRGGWDTGEAYFKMSKRGLLEYDPDDGEVALAEGARKERAREQAEPADEERSTRWQAVNRPKASRPATSPTAPRRASPQARA